MRIIGIGEGRSYEQAMQEVEAARQRGCYIEPIAGGWIVYEVCAPASTRPEDIRPQDVPGWGGGC